MNSTVNWQSILAVKQAQVERFWFTRWEFETLINELIQHPESPLAGLHFSLSFDSPFTNFSVGYEGNGSANAHTEALKDSRGGRCEIKWWPRSYTSTIPHETLLNFFEAWWKSHLRTPSAGLPDLKRDAAGFELAEMTVNERLREGKKPAVLCCDLDNFGQVNKRFNQETGDRVIKEFGALAETAVSPFGVLLHNGGDELVVLCPTGGALAAVRAAYAVRQAVTAHDFNISPLTIGMSAGLAATDTYNRYKSFQELMKEAGDVLPKFAKQPKKGRARFRPEPELSPDENWSAENYSAMAKSLIISAAFQPAPLGNAWLNALSAVVAEAAVESFPMKITSIAKDFIAWMDPAEGTGPIPPGHPPTFFPLWVSINPSSTPLALAFAIAHGIFQSSAKSKAPVLTVQYSDDAQSAGLYTEDHEDHSEIWVSEPAGQYTRNCKMSMPTHLDRECADLVAASRAVLIKIGHAPLPRTGVSF